MRDVVHTACRAAPGRPESQDRLLVLPAMVIVLDGASTADPRPRDGGWYADTLGRRLAASFTSQPDAPLRATLAEAIAAVTADHDLRPDDAPSSTVTLARWDAERVEALGLGDSPLVAFTHDGRVDVRCDTSLDAVIAAEHERMEHRLRRGGGFDAGHVDLVREMDRRLPTWRNRDGGYWICATDPGAAEHAWTAWWPRGDLAAVMVTSDGVSRGIDQYGQPRSWPAAREVVLRDGAEALVELVHEVEAGDPDGRRWPRSKRHDDKTVALVELV